MCVGMTGLAGTSEAVWVVAVVVLFVLYNWSQPNDYYDMKRC